MAVDDQTIERILKRMRRGAKFTVASTFFGQYRLRLRYGPFGVFFSKYEMNRDTYEALRERMKQKPGGD